MGDEKTKRGGGGEWDERADYSRIGHDTGRGNFETPWHEKHMVECRSSGRTNSVHATGSFFLVESVFVVKVPDVPN